MKGTQIECIPRTHTYHGKQIDVNTSTIPWVFILWSYEMKSKLKTALFSGTQKSRFFFYLINICYLSGWFSLHSIKVVHYLFFLLLLLFQIKRSFSFTHRPANKSLQIMHHMWYFLCFIVWFIILIPPKPFFSLACLLDKYTLFGNYRVDCIIYPF